MTIGGNNVQRLLHEAKIHVRSLSSASRTLIIYVLSNPLLRHSDTTDQITVLDARFRALVAAQNERKATTKLKRMFSKEKSYTRSAPIRLDAKEEEEARKRDAAMMEQRSGGAGAVS